eukprot:TRINITY_DN2361_c0_g2_i1.p1 TRINITY_DN2361_c0_g2~~TRINITY_DN2361_c0_g2_i1.p1  ORF type:complete len:709 (-),score=182.23 TRINITY_DN2361_c0_g2_i1:244-2088(-)
MAEKIELLESSVEAKEKVLEEIQDICEGQRRQYEELSSEHEDTKAALKLTQTTLAETEQSLKAAEFAINEREFMLKKHQHAEGELVNYATGIRNKLESSTKDVSGLHQKIDRKIKVETVNKELGSVFNSSFVGQLEELNVFVKAAVGDQIQSLSCIFGLLDSFKARKAEEFEDLSTQLQKVQTLLQHDRERVKESVREFVKALTSSFHGVESLHGSHRAQLDQILADSVGQAEEIIHKLQCKLLDQQRSIAVFANHQREIAQKNLEASRHIAESTQESLKFLESCSSDCASFNQLNFELQGNELKKLRTQYEERALEEEKRLMDEIAGLLKASRSRKLELVESGIIAVESALTAGKIESKCFTEKIGKKAADAFALVSAFHKTVEADDVENRAVAASKHCQMEGIIQDCIETGVAARQQWLELRTAVVNVEEEHGARVVEDVSGGLDLAAGFEVEMETVGHTAHLNIEANRAQLLKTLEDDFEKDENGVCEIEGAVTVQREKVFSMAGSHQNHSEGLHKRVKTYFQELVVDLPTATTPPKRSFTVPNESAIMRLRTPPVEDLVSEFHKENPPPPFYQEKLGKNNVVSTNILSYNTDTEVMSPRRENRAPLGVVN